MAFSWQMKWLVWRIYDGFICMSDTLAQMVSAWQVKDCSSWTVNQNAFMWPFQHVSLKELGLLTWQIKRPKRTEQTLQGLFWLSLSLTITSAASYWSVRLLMIAQIRGDGINLYLSVGGVEKNLQQFLISHTLPKLWAPLEQVFRLIPPWDPQVLVWHLTQSRYSVNIPNFIKWDDIGWKGIEWNGLGRDGMDGIK